MFALRRVAVRAIQFQPTRQLSTLRPGSSKLHIAQPALIRSFHQSLRRLAEEEQKHESPAEAQTGIKEESAAASDALSSPFHSTQNTESRGAREFPNDRPRNSQPSRILYVGNLFFEVTPAQLEAEFGRYGEITNSRIVSDFKGMSKGFGYVEFATQEAADRAVRELDQQVFQGRRMAVQYHIRREPRPTRRPDGARVPSKTLFVGNMSYQMSDRDLNDLFRDIKNVIDVRVAIDRRSGQPRGFAHADFMDVASAEKAKEFLEKKVVYGRELRVDFAQSSSRTLQVRDEKEGNGGNDL